METQTETQPETQQPQSSAQNGTNLSPESRSKKFIKLVLSEISIMLGKRNIEIIEDGNFLKILKDLSNYFLEYL